MSQTFTLIPFRDLDFHKVQWPQFKTWVEVTRSRQGLRLAYHLFGDWSQLEISTPVGLPERTHNLWETTCFECFFAIPDSAQYWEVNVAASGHWNVYRFNGYRYDMREEPALDRIISKLEKSQHSLKLIVEISLETLYLTKYPLELGITLVLEHKTGDRSYWALVHPASEADFHRREGFIASIDAPKD